MEAGQTVQESALHAGRQAWWPLDAMACSLGETTSSSGFLLGWDPQLSYFGLGAWGAGTGDLGTCERELEELVVPKCMESPVSEASTAAVAALPTPQDATAMPGDGELDELLQSLWGSDEVELAVGFTSGSPLKEASAVSSQCRDSEAGLLSDDDHFALNPILPTCPEEKALTQPQAEPPSSSSSHCNVDPWASDTGVAQRQATRANCSSKRPAREEKEEGDGSCGKKSRRAPSSAAGTGAGAVARPFTVVKPGGADGSVTLADINEWILTPPARPVRHPVGEFACAPRVAAGNRPAPSGKTVAGFTRLRTAGRGTITIVRTRG
ncbi:protein XRI1-like [Panicum virgatum]|uniref:Protein XRI1 n=1 Tax=Panicum virgatum TaxID=38727 RepID=A0A8T0R250_PANVG|nr:protein XRI1-like [Panicum virgatum]KAG2579275.1 hypothetical protein PVAP13_6NG249700 [Panicum virgatum]